MANSCAIVPNGVSRNVAIVGRLLDCAGNDIVRRAGVIPCNQVKGFQLSAVLHNPPELLFQLRFRALVGGHLNVEMQIAKSNNNRQGLPHIT